VAGGHRPLPVEDRKQPVQRHSISCTQTSSELLHLFPLYRERLSVINVKKTYQFKTHCKDDVMISSTRTAKIFWVTLDGGYACGNHVFQIW